MSGSFRPARCVVPHSRSLWTTQRQVMQSLRQYKSIQSSVTSRIQNGTISSVSNEKPSIVDQRSGSGDSDSLTTTTSLLPADLSTSDEPIIVGWEGPDDPLNPRNWSTAWKTVVFWIIFINTFACDWGSSADSQAGTTIAKAFHVSEEAEALSATMYTFGIAIGSLVAGPLSETFGRNPVYCVSRCFHLAWLVGVSLSPNFGSQCVFRLFAGLAASQFLGVHGATIADIYGPVDRALLWPLQALSSFAGTALSPLVGAWVSKQPTEQRAAGRASGALADIRTCQQIIQRGLDWRWAEWIAAFVSAATLLPLLFFLPETFAPTLLSWRAKHLRDLTGCPRFTAELDGRGSLQTRLETAMLRALHMVTREPVVVLMGSWLVLEYITVFMFLQGYTYIFGHTYGFSRGLIGTSFVAIFIGALLWTCSVPWYYRAYKRKVATLHEAITGRAATKAEMQAANSPGKDLPEPEYRLWAAIFAAPAFPISLFWLGWTNYPSISPWSNLGACGLLGFSWAGVYVVVYQYILDTYGIYAGSALAIISNWRYLASGTINMISRPMYNGIGVHWVMTMVGIMALLQAPIPLLFYHYGAKLRRKSAFASRYARPEGRGAGPAVVWR